MGVWTYAYDAVDNLTTQTDAKNVTITFQYDALNRLTQKTYSNQQSAISYTYDDATYQTQQFAKGKLTDVTETADSSRFGRRGSVLES